jgi:hypothetical protein
MSARPHDRLEELIAADALDALDGADREAMLREMGEHGPDCMECRQLVAEYAEVAAALATSLDPARLTQADEDRLVRAALDREGRGSGEPAVPAILSRHPAGGHARRWVAAVAVAASVAVVAAGLGYWIASRGQGAEGRFIAFVSRPGTKVVALEPQAGLDRQLVVAYRPGERGGWVVGDDLPDPPGDNVYELWFQPSPDAQMVPAGTFLPHDGRVVAEAPLGSSFGLLAVSVEPEGGSLQPTADPVFVSPPI